ncbi:LCP family protein [Clostridium oceanicum]|uniref:LCP family protein n=2 Tax=Clostridium oceanicum TaxID=1543 RepID=A0ABP3V1G9_9CLOT
MRSQKRAEKSKKTKIILSIITILVMLVITGVAYAYIKLGDVKKVPISKSDEKLHVSKDVKKYKDNDEIVNIAFFGLDRRSKDEPSRSDAIMVVSFDKKHKKIKLSSIMRDSYVDIEGHDKTKLNHAYAYGGPELAIKTINSNYNMNIRDFVAVDFFELEKIIDNVGGVEIPVRTDEINHINNGMKEVARIQGASIEQVDSPGLQTLNGKQAVAYARIRHTAGGDFERTDRQRTVLNAILEKVKKQGASKFPGIVSSILPNLTTSLSSTEILKMGASGFALGIDNVEQQRFPLDKYCKGTSIGGIYYLQYDKEQTISQMHKYIYEDIKPN